MLSPFLFIAIISGYWLDFHMSQNHFRYFLIFFFSSPWQSPFLIIEAFIWQRPTSSVLHFSQGSLPWCPALAERIQAKATVPQATYPGF